MTDVEKAIISNSVDLQLAYQPIIRTNDFQCAGAEALMRMYLPNGELVMPTVFIPILEQMNMIVEAEKKIFELACIQCKKWIELSHNTNFFIHVNLSPTQLSRKTLSKEVLSSIKHHSILPRNLVLEITENAMIFDLEKGIYQLKKLTKKGVKIAFDDFGTGYASLSYLKRLPIFEVKIDKFFVSDIDYDASARKFLFHVIKMLQNMDYKICVEGVETEMQRDFLAGLKVDYLQGYFFSKPILPLDFEQKFILITN